MADRKVIQTSEAPKPIGPYSQAIQAGEWVFCSGQIPLDPRTGLLVQGDIAIQTGRILDNLEAVLLAAGSSLDEVAKLTVFMTDLGQFDSLNQVLAEKFSRVPPPARSVIQVAALPKGALVEMDVVAFKKKQA